MLIKDEMDRIRSIPSEVILDHVLDYLSFRDQLVILQEIAHDVPTPAILRATEKASHGFRDQINHSYRSLLSLYGKTNIDELTRLELQNLALRAVRNGLVDLIEYIVLVTGFNPVRRISSLMRGTTTLLNEAVKSSQIESLKTLLDLGADVDTEDPNLTRLYQDPNIDTEIRTILAPYFSRRNISPYLMEDTVPIIRKKRDTRML